MEGFRDSQVQVRVEQWRLPSHTLSRTHLPLQQPAPLVPWACASRLRDAKTGAWKELRAGARPGLVQAQPRRRRQGVSQLRLHQQALYLSRAPLQTEDRKREASGREGECVCGGGERRVRACPNTGHIAMIGQRHTRGVHSCGAISDSQTELTCQPPHRGYDNRQQTAGTACIPRASRIHRVHP
jgi:hypothetical protein